jgi:hypothetical protein
MFKTQYRRPRRHTGSPYWMRSPTAYRLRKAFLTPAGLVTAVAATVILVVGIVLLLSGGGGEKKRTPRAFEALGYSSAQVYHSPQTPGQTAFVGAWIMPDGSLMTSFTQATGPFTGRERAPKYLQKVLYDAGYAPDPSGAKGLIDPKWDFWGLKLSVIYLRSTDGGRTWKRFREDPFRAAYPAGYTNPSTIALRDGSILRSVNGFDLLNDTSVPHTAFLQRLAPGAKSWSAPQVLVDPSRSMYQVSRIRRLSDGRLIAIGDSRQYPAPTNAQIAAGTYDFKRMRAAPSSKLLMVSSDEGRTWTDALTVPPSERRLTDEWDAAELPNGDLLAAFRVPDPKATGRNLRYQAILKKSDGGWTMSNLRRSPFPSSGHPELLAVRGGPILYVDTNGVWYTDDAGDTWLRLPGAHNTRYYPRSVQAADGTVYVLSHVGGDYWYGEGDESIQLQRFRVAQLPVPSKQ